MVPGVGNGKLSLAEGQGGDRLMTAQMVCSADLRPGGGPPYCGGQTLLFWLQPSAHLVFGEPEYLDLMTRCACVYS